MNEQRYQEILLLLSEENKLSLKKYSYDKIQKKVNRFLETLKNGPTPFNVYFWLQKEVNYLLVPFIWEQLNKQYLSIFQKGLILRKCDVHLKAQPCLVLANFEGVKIACQELNSCTSHDWKLTDLSSANFRDADLTQVVLDGANLAYANLQGAIINFRCFSDVDLCRTQFSPENDLVKKCGVTDLDTVGYLKRQIVKSYKKHEPGADVAISLMIQLGSLKEDEPFSPLDWGRDSQKFEQQKNFFMNESNQKSIKDILIQAATGIAGQKPEGSSFGTGTYAQERASATFFKPHAVRQDQLDRLRNLSVQDSLFNVLQVFTQIEQEIKQEKRNVKGSYLQQQINHAFQQAAAIRTNCPKR